MDALNNWVFFFGIIGSCYFAAVKFSRLAKSFKQNAFLFGFLGFSSVLTFLQLYGAILRRFEVEPGFVPAYFLLTLAGGTTILFYYLLRMRWSR